MDTHTHRLRTYWGKYASTNAHAHAHIGTVTNVLIKHACFANTHNHVHTTYTNTRAHATNTLARTHAHTHVRMHTRSQTHLGPHELTRTLVTQGDNIRICKYTKARALTLGRTRQDI